MFTRAGHKVFSWRRLSPRLSERADAIVWFPDDFEPPTPEVRRWLEDWLIEEPGRTLIYVGRDFDAARWYWKKIQPDVPDDQQRGTPAAARRGRRRFQDRQGEDPRVGGLPVVHRQGALPAPRRPHALGRPGVAPRDRSGEARDRAERADDALDVCRGPVATPKATCSSAANGSTRAN